jgi:hypothetical protein
MAERTSIADEIVTSVKQLAPGTTTCPGVLSEKILKARGYELSARDALTVLRECYLELRRQGKIRFFQRGKLIPPGKDNFRGPFRVAKFR